MKKTETNLPLEPGALRHALEDARRRTLSLVADLDDEQLIGPRLAIVNPLLWEIGHVAWFQERWNRRHLRGLPSLLEQADQLYDSMAVPHDTRWDLQLIGRREILAYMERTLEDTLEHLPDEPGEQQVYFLLLALFHEDMHAEAFAYTRQTLGYPEPPRLGGAPQETVEERADGDAPIEGGTYLLGGRRGDPFVFDNEKWAHAVEVDDFSIARRAVTQGEMLDFVCDGGYARRDLWSEAGWAWRRQQDAEQPLHWRLVDGAWQRRHYDRWLELECERERERAMVHVGWYEADAFCRWAGRRLPTEAEWELAASGHGKSTYPWGEEHMAEGRAHLDGASTGPISVHALRGGDTDGGVRQMMGNVWEWTSSDFGPFPGFVADPYKDYSEPWFYDHKVLRGGCWATRFRMLRNTWRNFYKPDRRDVWAGFRTCARIA